MKKSIGLFIAFALFTALPAKLAFAQNLRIDERGTSMEIYAQPAPMYPQVLLHEGVFDGSVRVCIEVDEYGELRDYLITDTTNKQFSKSVKAVIEDWNFSVPIMNGDPSSVVFRLKIDFSADGSVVNLTIPGAANLRLGFAQKFFEENYVAIASDLDAEPRPTSIVKPSIPTSALEDYANTFCIFEFFVDQQGNVRMPTLSEKSEDIDDRMLLAAQDALEQWKFVPPTVNGRPTNTKLAQRFQFVSEVLANR